MGCTGNSNCGSERAEQRGVSWVDVKRLFPTDEAAEAWFAEQRWGDSPECPHCDSNNVQTAAKHPTMPYRCRACRKRFSVRIGTAMENAKLGYRVWAVTIYILTTGIKGVSSMKLHRDLGVTQKTAWHLARRIRQTRRTAPEPVTGPVEENATCRCGREKNKQATKKLAARRGPAAKTAITGTKHQEAKQVAARIADPVNGKTLTGFVDARADARSTAHTDDDGGRGTLYVFYAHQPARHGVKEYLSATAHTNGVESCRMFLRRSYIGIVKRLARCIAESSRRFNDRPLDTINQMAQVGSGRHRYREWLT